jgi:hypothetical protein
MTTKLKTLAGSNHVKVVFERTSIAKADDFPTSDFYTDEVLVGFDSDSGKEDTLQTAMMNYQNPLITHDGKRIVFTRLWGTKPDVDSVYSFVVDWSKNATPRRIAKGMTACLWYDPASQKEYAIYARNQSLFADSIYKINIDDSLSDSLVLAGIHPQTEWLRTSADGKVFGGCLGPYGNEVAPMEVVNRGGGMLVQNIGGCWPSMPYDNSYRLVKTTADHDRWEVKGPNDTAGMQPTDMATLNMIGMFSELRMASYSANIFLLVTNAISGDNGTGNIKIVKTDSTLLIGLDTVTMVPPNKAGNSHHADLWAESPASSVAPLGNLHARPAYGPANADAKNAVFYTITGRKITSAAAGAKQGRNIPGSGVVVVFRNGTYSLSVNPR